MRYLARRGEPKSGAGSHRRRWWIAGAVAVVLGALICVALLTLGSTFDHWNGSEISITNNCGHDVYADDGRDGVPIKASETIRWDGASPSGDKTITLWTSMSEHVSGGDGLVVTLRGDSVLTGSQCQ